MNLVRLGPFVRHGDSGRDDECALAFEVLGLDVQFDGTFDTLTFGDCAPTYTARFVE